MSATFYNHALMQYNYFITVTNGTETMCYYQTGTATPAYIRYNLIFSNRVKRTRSFIKH